MSKSDLQMTTDLQKKKSEAENKRSDQRRIQLGLQSTKRAENGYEIERTKLQQIIIKN